MNTYTHMHTHAQTNTDKQTYTHTKHTHTTPHTVIINSQEKKSDTLSMTEVT